MGQFINLFSLSWIIHEAFWLALHTLPAKAKEFRRELRILNINGNEKSSRWSTGRAAGVNSSTVIPQDVVYLNIYNECVGFGIKKKIPKCLTRDSTQPSMKESSSVACSVGTKTVSNQMHVADLTPRPYHHVNNKTELSPNHPGVWYRLVVIWRRGSLSPCHDNDIEIILTKKTHKSKV